MGALCLASCCAGVWTRVLILILLLWHPGANHWTSVGLSSLAASWGQSRLSWFHERPLGNAVWHTEKGPAVRQGIPQVLNRRHLTDCTGSIYMMRTQNSQYRVKGGKEQKNKTAECAIGSQLCKIYTEKRLQKNTLTCCQWWPLGHGLVCQFCFARLKKFSCLLKLARFIFIFYHLKVYI